MRKILFRGIDSHSHEWVEGFYSEVENRGGVDNFAYIKAPRSNPVSVSINTVGQYIGVKDDNCVKIFEDDIVEMSYGGDKWVSPVSWFRGGFCVRVADFFGHDYDYMCVEDMMDFDIEHIEVIGNIHNNPDLITKK